MLTRVHLEDRSKCLKICLKILEIGENLELPAVEIAVLVVGHADGHPLLRWDIAPRAQHREEVHVRPASKAGEQLRWP